MTKGKPWSPSHMKKSIVCLAWTHYIVSLNWVHVVNLWAGCKTMIKWSYSFQTSWKRKEKLLKSDFTYSPNFAQQNRTRPYNASHRQRLVQRNLWVVFTGDKNTDVWTSSQKKIQTAGMVYMPIQSALLLKVSSAVATKKVINSCTGKNLIISMLKLLWRHTRCLREPMW